MARLSKAQLAGNVTLLPTAAPRQVENYRYADQRRAALAARRASPFHALYQRPQQREATRLASEMMTIAQTPEMLIVSVILNTMDTASAARVLEQLARGAANGSSERRQALAIAKASRLNVGQQLDLMWAIDRLSGREG